MRLIYSCLMASLVLCLAACQSEGGGEKVTDKGNRYTLYENGSGEVIQSGEYVYFHAELRNEADSLVFSTRDAGGDMPVVQAAGPEVDQISPVEDVLRYLRAGDSAVVRVNIEGEPRRPPGFEEDSVMIYTLNVEEVLSEEEGEARRAEKQAEAEAKRDELIARGEERREFAEATRKEYTAGNIGDLQETETGLKYVIHEEGTGPMAEAGNGVLVQYIGMLAEDGSIFDQSFERGQGIPFQLGTRQVIPGWDEGIALLKEGTKASFFIPSDLAYGANGTPDGSIPANSELMFYIELEDVQ